MKTKLINCPDCDGQGFVIKMEPILYRMTREDCIRELNFDLEGTKIKIGEEEIEVYCDECNGTGLIEDRTIYKEN